MKKGNLFTLHVSHFTFVLYLILAVAYGVVNPLFEAPDEQHHYFTAETIAETWQLPVVAADPNPWLRQEAAQPPLYYVLAAALIAPLPIDPAASRAQVHFNPYVRLGDPHQTYNLNAFVHGPAEAWPWRGPTLAAHLLRLLSAVLGLGTLWFIRASARRLWPDRPERSHLAVALAAFLPQFIFIHSAISNDPLIILLCTAALWQLLRLRETEAGMRGLEDYLILGVTIGLAALTKNQGLLLLAFAVGVLGLAAVRRREWRYLGQVLVAVVGPAVLVVGWWWWRNWLLYGDFTATSQFIQLAGGDRHYTLRQVLAESDTLWLSFIGRFGWMNVPTPAWLTWLWRSLMMAAAIGAAWQVAGSKWQAKSKIQNPKPKIWLAFWVLLVYAGLVAFMLKTPAAQGRLLFPAILPLALGMAYGLSRFRVQWLAAGLALLTAVYVGAVTLPRAYARPDWLTEDDLPETAARLHLDVGQGLELVASEIETTAAEPGDDVWLTLYWRAHQLPTEPPVLEARLLGRHFDLIGSVTGYHGRGQYPATWWPLATIVADRFTIRLDEGLDAPAEARLFVRLMGEPDDWPAGALKVTPSAWPRPAEKPLASFEGGIQLVKSELQPPVARPGQLVTLHLTWQVTAAIGRDFTTFVHLLGPGQTLVSQGDAPPLGGDYPTHWWEAGEQFSDAYQLSLPAGLPDGEYPIWIGLYDPTTIIRQPLYVHGLRQPNDAYQAGKLIVKRET